MIQSFNLKSTIDSIQVVSTISELHGLLARISPVKRVQAMGKGILFWFVLFFTIPNQGSSVTAYLVQNQEDLSSALAQNVEFMNIIIHANDSWRNIDLEMPNMSSVVLSLTFVNLTTPVHKIVGYKSFIKNQKTLTKKEILSIYYLRDKLEVNKDNFNKLSISNPWPKLYRLSVSGYDTLLITSDVSSNIVQLANSIYLSKESFKKILFYTFNFKLDISKNQSLISYFNFQFNRNNIFKEDSTNYYHFKPTNSHELYYEVSIDCIDSSSFEYVKRTLTPIFLTTLKSKKLAMTVGDGRKDLSLKFRRYPFAPNYKLQRTLIKCLNHGDDHNYFITQISKVPYHTCIYFVEGKLKCKELKLFDRNKALFLWLYQTPKINLLMIRLCSKRFKNVFIEDLSARRK